MRRTLLILLSVLIVFSTITKPTVTAQGPATALTIGAIFDQMQALAERRTHPLTVSLKTVLRA